MNFEQLQILTTLTATKNYRKTAKQLHLTSKDIHKAISTLENELGYPLVNENSDGIISLTMYGEEVVDTSARILKLKQTMLYMLEDLKNADGKLDIKIGSTLPAKQYSLYNNYKTQHPGLNINYVSIDNPSLDMVINDEIDILECEKKVLPNELSFTEIQELPLQVYISSTNDLFTNKSICLDDLKDYKIYVSNNDSVVLHHFINQLDKDHIKYELIDGNDRSIFKVCERDTLYIQEPIITYPYATIKTLPLNDDRFNYSYGLVYKNDAPNVVKNLLASLNFNVK